MKLLFCAACEDVVKLSTRGKRTCECGQSWGEYTNSLEATIGGQAIPLGFANSSLAHALQHRPDHGLGERFEAFVIPRACATVRTEKAREG